ncbi:MAG: hypothetical protein QOG00_230 [Pyrinomonadaceae bacterium]|nr:hypothetical protein [Pyrinomonadaceae bacterium]
MANWMDKISDDIEKKMQADRRAEAVKQSVGSFYTGLEKIVREQTTAANNRFFEGRDVLEFSYENHENTFDHFIVRKPTFPALIAKLKVDHDTGIFTITISEKPTHNDNDYEEVERLEVNVTTDVEGRPRLARNNTLQTLTDVAGLMLAPLVRRTLGLK